MHATHSIETPLNAVGAVSILRIVSSDFDTVFQALNVKPVKNRQIRLASVLGLDDALLARFDDASLLIMPHGGIGITRAISHALTGLGFERSEPSDPLVLYPEAQDIHEARMLVALSTSTSPMAVDLLLDQPRRWRESNDPDALADASVLNRLLVPPLIVAIGRANIGKSSLVNALAGTSIAMVSGIAGTTRDHVGVLLNLGGLAVRWIDTPGIDEQVTVGDELAIVEPVIQAADLIVHAIGHQDADGDLDPRLAHLISPTTPILRLGVRSDLGQSLVETDLSCSAMTSAGIESLATAINHRLIDPAALNDPLPWRYWDS